MTPRLTFFTLALCSLVACGGDDDVGEGPGSGPVEQAQAEAGCRRSCEHDFACNSAVNVEACTADCVDDVTSGYFRADVFAELVQCIVQLDCASENIECLGACTPTGAHELWEAQCREVMAPCTDTQADLDEMCETQPSAGFEVGLFCMYTPALMNQLTACIPDGTGCEAAYSCLDDVLQTAGVPG